MVHITCVSVSSSSSVPSGLNSGFNPASHIVNPVLTFLKAFPLTGDKDSLKSRTHECFSGSSLSEAMKLLRNCCSQSFVPLGLQYRPQCDSSLSSSQLQDVFVSNYNVVDAIRC